MCMCVRTCNCIMVDAHPISRHVIEVYVLNCIAFALGGIGALIPKVRALHKIIPNIIQLSNDAVANTMS